MSAVVAPLGPNHISFTTRGPNRINFTFICGDKSFNTTVLVDVEYDINILNNHQMRSYGLNRRILYIGSKSSNVLWITFNLDDTIEHIDIDDYNFYSPIAECNERLYAIMKLIFLKNEIDYVIPFE